MIEWIIAGVALVATLAFLALIEYLVQRGLRRRRWYQAKADAASVMRDVMEGKGRKGR